VLRRWLAEWSKIAPGATLESWSYPQLSGRRVTAPADSHSRPGCLSQGFPALLTPNAQHLRLLPADQGHHRSVRPQLAPRSEIRRLPHSAGARRKRVRLTTRGGYWISRHPWIVESALKNRHRQFIIDGEAVVLGVDGVANFNALHSRKHDDEVQLYAFDILALDGDDLRRLPLSMPSRGYWHAGRPGSLWRRSNKARSGLTCSAQRAGWDWRG
jgi:hypothetical protein